MKIYGVMRYAFFSDAPAEETLCKRCYDGRFAGVGKLSPLTRHILGYTTITKRSDADGVRCDNCCKDLV